MSGNPYPVVLFDLDGTLVDSAPDLANALNHVLEHLALPRMSLDEVNHILGHGGRRLIEAGLAKNGKQLSETEIDDCVKLFISFYGENIANSTLPFPGVLDCLEELKSVGVKCAVATNKFEGLSIKLLTELDMLDHFEFVAGSDTWPVKKPDAGHLTYTIEKIGGNKFRSVMVGDSATDVNAARNANIPVIGVPFGYTPIPMKKLNPDILVNSYDEFMPAVSKLLNL